MSKKTIWITGGSTGIGKALAIKFANKGWNVAVSARRVELLDDLSKNYENISSFPLDVTDKTKCIEVFNQIKTHFGNIDICFFQLVHGIQKKEKENRMLSKMEDVFKEIFFGTVNSIKSSRANIIEKEKNGIITIVSSIAGYRGLPNSTGYGPSKICIKIILAEKFIF